MEDVDIHWIRAFVMIVDSGNLTLASRRLGRTQPAISLQLKRLEDRLGRPLFQRQGRRLSLNRDGELFLPSARNILRSVEEAVGEFGKYQVSGPVILGTPDVYAAYLLPDIFEQFGATYPQVQIELRCDTSVRLLRQIAKGQLDLALVTRLPGMKGGDFVRREQLIWVGSERHDVHKQLPVPLATVNPDGLFRHVAIAALQKRGKPYRIACVSDSFGGLQAAVYAGLAVTVVARSSLVHGFRELKASDGMPDLPSVDLVLHQRSGPVSPAMKSLSEYIARKLTVGGKSLRHTRRTS